MRRAGSKGGSGDQASGMDERVIIRVADLRAHGATYTEARRSVSTLERISRGAYADTEGLSPEQRHLMKARAVLCGVSEVGVSHITAAVNWELPVLTSMLELVHLSPYSGRAGKPKGGPRHHIHTMPITPAEVVDKNDLPTTSALRTVLDCARLLDADWGVVIADDALHRGLITSEELTSRASGIRRLRGAERARLLPSRTSCLAESPAESLLRLRLLRIGLRPVEQVTMQWIEGAPRVDFLIDDWLVVEFDGRGKYEIDGDPAAAHWAEKLRHDRLVEAGYTVIHVTWAQLWDEPRLARRINAVLAQGPSERFRRRPPVGAERAS